MRSCKKAGTGCLPPHCRAGVSAARLQVTHLDPLRTADPRSAQAAPLVTPCLRDHRHRLEGDTLVHRPPRSAAYRRPATACAGRQPRRRPGAVPVPQPGRAGGNPVGATRAPSTPGRHDANPRAAVATSRAFPAQLTHRAGPPGHQSFQVFALSTRYPQNAGSYPHSAAVIHWLIHSPSTGLPDVTRGTPGPASPHVIS